ncbi:MAG: hypothetical protein IPL27_27075 [Lewinellaceae bacterium]|nr:hypothetical protein [Lewinellaceae bacterium]
MAKILPQAWHGCGFSAAPGYNTALEMLNFQRENDIAKPRPPGRYGVEFYAEREINYRVKTAPLPCASLVFGLGAELFNVNGEMMVTFNGGGVEKS